VDVEVIDITGLADFSEPLFAEIAKKFLHA
jgi:hypothetical protein